MCQIAGARLRGLSSRFIVSSSRHWYQDPAVGWPSCGLPLTCLNDSSLPLWIPMPGGLCCIETPSSSRDIRNATLERILKNYFFLLHLCASPVSRCNHMLGYRIGGIDKGILCGFSSTFPNCIQSLMYSQAGLELTG